MKRRDGAKPRLGAQSQGGRSFDPIYNVWYQMWQRCANPKNKRWDKYGGRGIKVCDRWLIFHNFLADMGERPAGMTLDRKDNDGDYTPENCRWATRLEQNNNRTNQRMLTIGVETKTVAQWSSAFGVKYHILYNWVVRGKPIEQILQIKAKE